MGKLITVPFAALLRWTYAITGSYGLSIILFALVIKLVLLPFQMKSKRSMVRMGRLTGKQQELQKKYANNQQKYNEELQKLYQEEGINPMGGCLWSFLPIFLMLPLYSIIYRPITYFMGLSEEVLEEIKTIAAGLGYGAGAGTVSSAYEQIGLTDFISEHWAEFQGKVDGLINVDFTFLGIDLSTQPGAVFSGFTMTWSCIGLLLIPILAALSQFLSSKIMAKSNGQDAAQQQQMRMMNLLMPLISIWFCFNMPAAMGVYWIINSVLMAIQEALLGKFYTKKLNAEEEEREAKRDAARKMRMEEAKKRAAEQKEQEAKRPKKQPQKSLEKKVSTNEAGRIGERPYARGRSYQEDRYDK